MSDVYKVIGQNNRNLLVQSKRVAPFHEDITRVQPFDPSSIAPGQYTRIKVDLKHPADRELILNDLRLHFTLDFANAHVSNRKVGKVFAVRGTDLIRELVVKINEDIVFKCDRQMDLSMLWEMNNHRTLGDVQDVDHSILLNHGNIPRGNVPAFVYNTALKHWYTRSQNASGGNIVDNSTTYDLIRPGMERNDGRPGLIYDDQATDKAGNATQDYLYEFDISLNQLVGPIFHRLHLRRIEYVQIEIMFEPWVSTAGCQNFLLFQNDPVAAGAIHPYSVARFTNLEVRQYRTTLLDGTDGFTLPDSRMLSWLMHRYSRREFTVDFSNTNVTLDIQLHDWEIRTNIVRVWWMLAPTATDSTTNGFHPFGAPSDYENFYGCEIRWKNDVVLDLDTTYEVARHYILSDNKRYGLDDPFMKVARLTFDEHKKNNRVDQEIELYDWMVTVADATATTTAATLPEYEVGSLRYEFPIYHVDLNMNIQYGMPGAEIIGGIVNDTSDYVIRLKRTTDESYFKNTGVRTLFVWLEYQTLVNLAAGSNQFQRGSQVITKQLNPQ